MCAAACALALGLAAAGAARGANDEAQANSHDAAWLSAWVAHCQSIYTATSKTTGFVLEVGDSITHANPYAQWPRYGTHTASDDQALCSWVNASAWGSNNSDYTVLNGWWLAAADTNGNRGMTATSGVTTGEYLSGDGNGGTAMPALTNQHSAQSAVADGSTYSNNLNLTTVAAAFQNAQFAVLMLGSNDCDHGVDEGTFIGNIGQIVTILEGQHIVVILSTIPPNPSSGADTLRASYNTGLAGYAQSHGLPLIDFCAEVLARQPEPACFGTLIDAGDPHPTAYSPDGTTYNSASDPYADGGSSTTHTTGAAATEVGYLLRSWLTVQKLKEVQADVVNGAATTTGTATSTGTGTATATATGTSGSTGTATATGSDDVDRDLREHDGWRHGRGPPERRRLGSGRGRLRTQRRKRALLIGLCAALFRARRRQGDVTPPSPL